MLPRINAPKTQQLRATKHKKRKSQWAFFMAPNGRLLYFPQ